MRLSREEIVAVVKGSWESGNIIAVILDESLKDWELQMKQLKYDKERLEKEITDSAKLIMTGIQKKQTSTDCVSESQDLFAGAKGEWSW